MKKKKEYPLVKFTPKIIDQAVKEMSIAVQSEIVTPSYMRVKKEFESWNFDNLSEFYSDYQDNLIESGTITFYFNNRDEELEMSFSIYGTLGSQTSISVNASNREIIERVLLVFDNSEKECKIPEPPTPPWESQVKIFIGHGNDPIWNEIRHHLHDKHNFRVNAYETGARAGHEIRDVLEEMLSDSSFAILIFTGENIDAEGKRHPRENVIHELGLFQGKLGSKRAIVLLEAGVERFSNIEGVQYIPFKKESISATISEILATLKREFAN